MPQAHPSPHAVKKMPGAFDDDLRVPRFAFSLHGAECVGDIFTRIQRAPRTALSNCNVAFSNFLDKNV